MTQDSEAGPKTDSEGRIIDATGRPLRDRRSRTHGREPFRGKSGRENPQQKRLDQRIAIWEEEQKRNNKTGRRRPGSLNRRK